MDALWLTEDENRVLRKAIALALTTYDHCPDEDGYHEWLCDQLHQLERRLLWLQGEGVLPEKSTLNSAYGIMAKRGDDNA